MTIGIYCIEHVESGKKYIGRSINIEKRFSAHKTAFKNESYKGTNRHLHASVRLYGLEQFTFKIIEVTSLDTLCERETFWIHHYKSYLRGIGYNLTVSSGNTITQSDETKSLISLKYTEARKIACSTRLKGVKRSEEDCRNIKAGWTDEKRRHHSIIMTGKEKSESHCKAISRSRKGLKLSPEVLANRPVRVGRKISDDEKVASSLRLKGIPKSRQQLYKKAKYSYQRFSKDGTLLSTYELLTDVEKDGFSKRSVAWASSVKGVSHEHAGYLWGRIPKISLQENGLSV